MWGSSPLDYVSFARESITSGANGRFLDAGCGSLVFTASSYLESDRPIVAFDESLAMLRRARKRLRRLAGTVPDRIMLLQGDLTDLPFRAESFQSVLCMNVLHHIEDLVALIANLRSVLSSGGHLHLTSLVYNRFLGNLYLNALHASGAFVRPRSNLELRTILNQVLGENMAYRVKGNMAFASMAISAEDQFRKGDRAITVARGDVISK
jgi:SAM-dependent methyltransferase